MLPEFDPVFEPMHSELDSSWPSNLENGVVDKGKKRAVDEDHDEGARKRPRHPPSPYPGQPNEGMGTTKHIPSQSMNRNARQPDSLTLHDWEADHSGDEGKLPAGLDKIAVSSSSAGRGKSLANAGIHTRKSTYSAPIRRVNQKRT
jgi:hypothetical protein